MLRGNDDHAALTELNKQGRNPLFVSHYLLIS